MVAPREGAAEEEDEQAGREEGVVLPVVIRRGPLGCPS